MYRAMTLSLMLMSLEYGANTCDAVPCKPYLYCMQTRNRHSISRQPKVSQ